VELYFISWHGQGQLQLYRTSWSEKVDVHLHLEPVLMGGAFSPLAHGFMALGLLTDN
jgi:hypothetical protein